MTTRKSPVLVLGAGASYSYGLPLGSQLKDEIASTLRAIAPAEEGRAGRGTPLYFALQASASRAQLTDLLAACKKIWSSMPQVLSIDNFIHSHRDEPLIELCSKLAIADVILRKEAASSLNFDQSNIYKTFNFVENKERWFNLFFQRLVEQCSRAELSDRLKSLGIICFNYDRCFEHHLQHSLKNYYQFSDEEAAQKVNEVDIYHPYGTVGSLPLGILKGHVVGFGRNADQNDIIKVAQSLRTFTEGIGTDVEAVGNLRSMLKHAHRVAFMGFAFHQLNMELMFAGPPAAGSPYPSHVIATATKVSNPDCEDIRRDLAAYFGTPHERISINPAIDCEELWKQYTRRLSLVNLPQ